MIEYFIFLAVVVIISFFISNLRNNKFFTFLLVAVLSLFAGLRNPSVGTDTFNYIYRFALNLPLRYNGFLDLLKNEYGYLLLEKFISFFFNEYWVLLIVISVLVNSTYIISVKKLSINVTISIFTYIVLGVYLFHFNGARQAIAAAIYSMSLIHIKSRSFKKYLFIVLLASLFHKTALVTLPIYFIVNGKLNLKKMSLLTLYTIFFTYFIWGLLRVVPESFSARYLAYEDRGSRGAVLLTIYFTIITFFLILIRNKIRKQFREDYNFYLNIVIVHTLIYVLVFMLGQDVNILRLSLYFSIGFILIWPLVFRSLPSNTYPILVFLFSIVHLVFYYVYLSKMSHLVPFAFNNSIF